MNFPLVSIIIPTYNRLPLIERAIVSVLNQTYPNWELILLDDGSTDDTWSFLLSKITGWKRNLISFGKNQKNILLYQLEHHGVSRARNIGVQNSSGTWICFLDSDDEWYPEKISKQIQFHIQFPEYNFSQTREFWNKNGNLKKPSGHQEKLSGDFFKQSLDRCMVTISSFMAKRETWDKIGGFRDELLACEDFDLWNRILINDHSIGLLDEFLLIRYGGHKDQLSMIYPAMERFRLYSLIKTREELTSSGDWERLSVNRRRLWDAAISKRLEVLIAGRKKRGLDMNSLEILKDSIYKNTDIQIAKLNDLLSDPYH